MTVQSMLQLEAYREHPMVKRMGDGDGKEMKSLRSVALTLNRKGAMSNMEGRV